VTQILSCLTPEFAVMVADRRLVNLGSGDVVDDEAGKMVMLGGQAVISFTGLANLKPPPRGQTDLWIVDQLSSPPDTLPAIFERLGDAANRTFSNIAHLGPRAKRHSFVSVGWHEGSADALEPFWLGISNAEDRSGKWRERAKPSFEVSFKQLQDKPLRLRVTGQPLPRHIYRSLRARLAAQATLTGDAVVHLLATAMRETASVNSFVGQGMMAAILPRQTVDMDRGFSMPSSDGADLETAPSGPPGGNSGPTCLYFPSGSNEGAFFAPHLVTRSIALSDIQIRQHAATPEEIRREYEEGLKKRR
jgi:hypothetical protein